APDAVLCGSCLRTRDTARETRGRRCVFRLCWPASNAYSALLRVRALALPLPGGRRATPARLALERPMAMACSGDLAPCSPRRILWISSRTNSPAWVVGALPSRLSLRAFSTVLLSGIIALPSGLSRLCREGRIHCIRVCLINARRNQIDPYARLNCAREYKALGW